MSGACERGSRLPTPSLPIRSPRAQEISGKPANVTVGAEVKFVVEGRKLIILDEDQKEHKASIVITGLMLHSTAVSRSLDAASSV